MLLITNQKHPKDIIIVEDETEESIELVISDEDKEFQKIKEQE
jgi:hypothetical protein